MGPVIDTAVKARAYLDPMIKAATTFGLTNEEIDQALEKSQLAFSWSASTSFVYGSIVIPTAAKRNGHKYRLVKFDGNGTLTGTTEPSWHEGREGTFGDGNITWREDGRDFNCFWDLRAAAHQCWLTMAGNLADKFKFSTDNQSFELQQKYEHCLEMAEKYTPIIIGDSVVGNDRFRVS